MSTIPPRGIRPTEECNAATTSAERPLRRPDALAPFARGRQRGWTPQMRQSCGQPRLGRRNRRRWRLPTASISRRSLRTGSVSRASSCRACDEAHFQEHGRHVRGQQHEIAGVAVASWAACRPFRSGGRRAAGRISLDRLSVLRWVRSSRMPFTAGSFRAAARLNHSWPVSTSLTRVSPCSDRV